MEKTDGRTKRWMDQSEYGWIDGWTDRLTDGQINMNLGMKLYKI